MLEIQKAPLGFLYWSTERSDQAIFCRTDYLRLYGFTCKVTWILLRDISNRLQSNPRKRKEIKLKCAADIS